MTSNNDIKLHDYNSATLLTLPIKTAKMDKNKFDANNAVAADHHSYDGNTAIDAEDDADVGSK